jgi:ribokinase
MSTVVVVGSVNADLLVRVESLPEPGETVLALGATSAAGGKGQAQAIAAARFGATTQFISIVGDDAEGRDALSGLQREGVDTSLVRTSSNHTGRAVVATDDSGENSIIVIPGANAELDSLTGGDKAAIRVADVVLMQLENGTKVASEAIACAHGAGVTVILNAAPPPELLPLGVDELIGHVDFLIVNEGECLRIGGSPDVDSSARALAQLAGAVLVTLGAAGGSLYRGQGKPLRLPALEVQAVDTTGAGDAFCGVFAAAIAEGRAVESAFQLALVGGSIATLTAGNVPAIPTRDQIMASGLGRL